MTTHKHTIEEKAMQKMNSVALSKYSQFATKKQRLETLLASLQAALMEIDDIGLTKVGVGNLENKRAHGIVLDNVLLCDKCKKLFYADQDDKPKCDDDIYRKDGLERKRKRVYPYLSFQERERLDRDE